MSNAEQILEIGSVDCNNQATTFLMSWSLGKPARTAEEYGGPGVDIAALGAVDMSALVESRFVVMVTGASIDAALSTVASIAAEVRDLAGITVGLKNSAHTGTLVPRIGECIEIPLAPPLDSMLVNQNYTKIEIVVRRDPYFLASTETPYTASGFDCPALISLDAQTGQDATPLDLLLDAGALTLAGCYVGHTDDEAAVIDDFVKPMATAAWLKTGGGAATGAAATDAAGYPAGGTSVWETKDATGDTTLVDVTDHSGEYAVFANVKYRVGSAGVYVKQQFDGWVPITTAGLRLLYLGNVSLPTQAVRGSGASTLAVSIKGDGTNYAAVNTVSLLPVGRGLTGYALASGHVHALRWENGVLYADDAVDNSKVVGGAAPLRVLGGQIVVLAENATAAPTTHLHATVSATPCFEQFPVSFFDMVVASGEATVVDPLADTGYGGYL